MGDYSEKDLSNFSKVYLWEQLEAVEDERNKLLNLCEDLYDYFDMNEGCLTPEGESYLEQLARVLGK